MRADATFAETKGEPPKPASVRPRASPRLSGNHRPATASGHAVGETHAAAADQPVGDRQHRAARGEACQDPAHPDDDPADPAEHLGAEFGKKQTAEEHHGGEQCQEDHEGHARLGGAHVQEFCDGAPEDAVGVDAAQADVDDESQYDKHPPAFLGRHPEKLLLAHVNPPSLDVNQAEHECMENVIWRRSIKKTQNRATIIGIQGNCQMENRSVKLLKY